MTQITDFRSISLDTDEDSYCISMKAELLDPDEWSLCTTGSEITIDINGTSFLFIIDNRERTRSFGETSYSIEGRSITAKLGEGNASQLYYEWESDQTAQSIVQGLCDDHSITLSWDILDWTIPANTLIAEGEYPIEVIRRIADAAGAILQTTPGGTLKVQPKYSVTPSHYYDADQTPTITLDDADDIISISETKDLRSLYNAVILMNKDLDSDISYSIEEIDWDYDSKSVTLAVRVYPFQDSVELLSAGDPSLVSIVNYGEQTESVEEIIEIVEGQGSSEKPIFSVDSYSYNWDNLGSLEHDGTNLYTNVVGESLLNITYTTKYHKFVVTHDERTTTLFYTEE